MKILSKLTLALLLVAVMVLTLGGCTGSTGPQGPVGREIRSAVS